MGQKFKTDITPQECTVLLQVEASYLCQVVLHIVRKWRGGTELEFSDTASER
jgi:hypothetical protein